jgi:hypothetical protein
MTWISLLLACTAATARAGDNAAPSGAAAAPFDAAGSAPAGGAGGGSASGGSVDPARAPGVPVDRPENPAALERPSECRSNLYAEPSLLVGSTAKKSVARVRGALGVRYARCPTRGPEGFNLRIGYFFEGGTEALGDAFSHGPELEYDTPTRGLRLGGRVAVGIGDVPTLSLGGRARFRYVALGLDGMYSFRANGQGAAFGVLANFTLRKAPGLVAIGLVGLLGVVAVASVNPP